MSNDDLVDELLSAAQEALNALIIIQMETSGETYNTAMRGIVTLERAIAKAKAIAPKVVK